MKYDIGIILDLFNEKLRQYNIKCDKLKKDTVPFHDFEINFSNERSVAYFLTSFIERILSDVFELDVNVLNESLLKLENKLSEDNKKQIEEIIKDFTSKDLLNRDRFIPDTLVHIEKGDFKLDVFIEYKVDNAFKYIKFAKDLMKYIIYSFNSKRDSVFVYVLFNKKSDSLEFKITEDNHVKYQEIENVVDVSKLDSNSSIFIYKHNEYLGLGSDIELETKAIMLEKITDLIDEIEKMEITPNRFEKANNFEDNIWYKNKGVFGRKVLGSRTIRKSYKLIEELYDLVRESQFDFELPDEIISNEAFNGINEDSEGIITEIGSYFNNQIRSQLFEGKQKVSEETYNVSYKRANWIMQIIVLFVDLNDIEVRNTNLYEMIQDKMPQTIKEQTKIYGTSQYKPQLNKLALGIILFIHNLYDFLFEFNDLGDLVYSSEYVAFLKKKEFLVLVNRLFKIIKHRQRGKEFDWNIDLNEIGNRILDSILESGKKIEII